MVIANGCERLLASVRSCERLRAVANGCQLQSSVEETHLHHQTLRKGEPFATQPGKCNECVHELLC